MFTLTTMETAVFDIAHLIRIPTSEHLVDEVIIVGRIVARAALFKPLPVLGKDLFKTFQPAMTSVAMALYRVGLRGGCRAMLYHVGTVKATLSSGPFPNMLGVGS